MRICGKTWFSFISAVQRFQSPNAVEAMHCTSFGMYILFSCKRQRNDQFIVIYHRASKLRKPYTDNNENVPSDFH